VIGTWLDGIVLATAEKGVVGIRLDKLFWPPTTTELDDPVWI